MRVRTAIVNPTQASGVTSLFELAVERNLAWVIGVGHVYAGVEKAARKAGYEAKILKSGENEYWVAVRFDLIAGAVESPEDQVVFETNRKGLGWVAISFGDDVQVIDDNHLVFYVDPSEESLSTTSHDERIKDLSTSIVPVEHLDFRYTEVLYSISALKD